MRGTSLRVLALSEWVNTYFTLNLFLTYSSYIGRFYTGFSMFLFMIHLFGMRKKCMNRRVHKPVVDIWTLILYCNCKCLISRTIRLTTLKFRITQHNKKIYKKGYFSMLHKKFNQKLIQKYYFLFSTQCIHENYVLLYVTLPKTVIKKLISSFKWNWTETEIWVPKARKT